MNTINTIFIVIFHKAMLIKYWVSECNFKNQAGSVAKRATLGHPA